MVAMRLDQVHLTTRAKGRVERAIRYVCDSFWAGRAFTTLAECNRQALLWRDQVTKNSELRSTAQLLQLSLKQT